MKAIIHIDGDAFFASVEQALNYKLRGKPIVTGGERSIAASMSYEAKALGVTRGMPVFQIRKLNPSIIIVPSNYDMYSIFARRMYNIVRTFTPDVEEYSIDECFADLTGLDAKFKMPYSEIALMIKKKLEESLGITFGVGLGPNKVLAKIASKWRKPAGFTQIWPDTASEYLKALPVGKVWGIGPATSIELNRYDIRTALDFAEKDANWINHYRIAKGYQEIWHELNGRFVKELSTVHDPDAASIIKSRTFSPPSSDRGFVLSQLSKNVAAACRKARSIKVAPREIRFYLKTQDFRYVGLDLTLPIAANTSPELMRLIEANFDHAFRKNTLYRTTGIVLKGISPEENLGMDLFGEKTKLDKSSTVFKAVDRLNHRFGDNTVFLAGSMRALGQSDELRPITKEERLDIPFLGKVA
jgi:DNA polymerase-4